MKPGSVRRPLGPLAELLDPEPPPREGTVQVLGVPRIDTAIDGGIDGSGIDLAPPGDIPAPPADDVVPPGDIPAPPHPRGAKARKGSRSGSQIRPYELADGSGVTIKQSFHASGEFDELWRELPGLLPRGVKRHGWVEKVLTRHILALKRAKTERLKAE
jgi:hypothetical protein